jgi:hypothetical protein
MKHAIRHQQFALQRIIDSSGSTSEEVTGARAELRKLQGDPPQQAAPAFEGGFEMNAYFEDLLAAGPYVGARYLDLFGVNDETPLSKYCARRAAHFGIGALGWDDRRSAADPSFFLIDLAGY